MATLLNLLDDMRDRLNDSADAQIPKATKIRYINHGIRASWPRLYRTVRDVTLLGVGNQYDYNIPALVGSNSKILSIEVESGVATGRYNEFGDTIIVPGLTDPILQFTHTIPTVGARIRITAAVPLTELAGDADVYNGPSQTDELPVLYAMGLALTRRLDDRIDHRRWSTTQGTNAVGPDEIMTAGQFNFAQFELLLERFAMPLPAQQN